MKVKVEKENKTRTEFLLKFFGKDLIKPFNVSLKLNNDLPEVILFPGEDEVDEIHFQSNEPGPKPYWTNKGSDKTTEVLFAKTVKKTLYQLSPDEQFIDFLMMIDEELQNCKAKKNFYMNKRVLLPWVKKNWK